MRIRPACLGFLMTLLLLVPSPGLSRDTGSPAVFHLGPGSAITIEGTSNLSAWTCTSRDVQGVLRIFASRFRVDRWLEEVHRTLMEEETLRFSPPPGLARPQARLAVPVRSFECGSSGMNRDMYRALRADSYPRILFGYYSLREVQGVDGDSRDSDDPSIHAVRAVLVGGLVLAGRGRTIELTATFEPTGEREYRVRAEKETRMSRFGIEPPRALLGMIRARDPITLRFDMTVRAGPPSDTVPRAGEGTRSRPSGGDRTDRTSGPPWFPGRASFMLEGRRPRRDP